MTDETELLAMVGQLYEAAADPSAFANLPAALARHFDTESAMIHTCAPRSLHMPAVLAVTENFDSWAQSSYVDHYHYVNKWFQRGLQKPIGSVVLGQELVDETELQRIEWYEYCYKLKAFHVLGATMHLSDDSVGGVGFHRPKSAKRFDEADRRKMQIVLPHLQRTLQLQGRLATLTQERAVALDVIESFAIGIIFIDADGRLLFANRVAERVLQSGDGLTLSQGRVCPQDPRQGQTFERLTGEAAQTSAGRSLQAGGMLPVRTRTGATLPILIAPLRAMSIGYGPARPAAIVIFSDPDGGTGVPSKILQSAFGLTPAQARLVSALIGGQSLSEYADFAGISINTVKTQMREVFQRTGHTRQVDLLRTIAANPVLKLSGH